MKKLLAHFDSIEHPTIPQLAVGTIFETLARNSEIRALRFKNFHFDANSHMSEYVEWLLAINVKTGLRRILLKE